MYTEEAIRASVEQYMNTDGLVMYDLAHVDGNDAPHKTGFYFGGLALKEWIVWPDVEIFIGAIESVLTLDGRLLRHRNTKLPHTPSFWQPGSRDQYQAVLYGLGLCYKIGGFAQARNMARELYSVLRWGRVARLVPLCSRDIVSPQHWYAFGLCAGVKHKPWFRWLAGLSEVVNSLLLLTKHSESANILAYYRLMTVHALDGETPLHTLADWILDLKFDYATEMRVYWTRRGGPPIYKVFLGEETNERKDNADDKDDAGGSASSADSGGDA